jgi:translation initiation factor IF-2
LSRHNVIYEIVDKVKEAMEDLLPPIREERVAGTAIVQQAFHLQGKASIGGLLVQSGVLRRKNAVFRVTRAGRVVFEGKLTSIRHEKRGVCV